MTEKQTVLITGCSNGGLGAELAKAFHARGVRVLAAASNISKMSDLASLGIETFEIDVQSTDSIAKCKEKESAATGGILDILVNNAGIGCPTTILNADLGEARRCYETNVFSPYYNHTSILPPPQRITETQQHSKTKS